MTASTSTLVHCERCQKDASSEFDFCPHCSAPLPGIAECAICRRSTNRQESVSRPKDARSQENRNFFHQDCYRSVHAERRCPVCKEEEPGEAWGTAKACHRCGHQYYNRTCGQCGLPIIDDARSIANERRSYDAINPFRHECCDQHYKFWERHARCLVDGAEVSRSNARLCRRSYEYVCSNHSVYRGFLSRRATCPKCGDELRES
jgi:ribosomal protein L37E